MPSIPQSLLWISLVVLWLFVLVPMLISKREAVRRTSDVALATRVVNSATNSRLLKRGGPASGHRSDPHWQPSEDELQETFDESEYDDDIDIDDEAPTKSIVVAAAEVDDPDTEYLDVETVDEPAGALPAGEADDMQLSFDEAEQAEAAEEAEPEEVEAEAPQEDCPTAVYDPVTDEYEEGRDGTGDEYEYVEDSSGLEAPEESDLQMAESMVASRRRRYDTSKSAAISARKYKFRKRMLAVLTLVMMASAAAAYFLDQRAWYVCGGAGAVTLLYLVYLRRQTRIEERLRRRRAQRAARARLGVENTEDRDLDLVPSRLRRPGSVVLEIDDEDPIFEHLDYAPSARDYDLPRAAGQ
ncbi:hypothetical protein CQY20_08375 [Mycolicibacterium agri]|uniref:Membrane protein n=1 Tax=Mycolicibacterium agri TaxID=36811 RepID=A0A2A7N8L9_MYCAG|nr:gephyrin-like molybdotransferase receptor GlpR [Mycolicibacterium agri]PEG40244.1 hypothetical protein CQY20_08375 [Mycolicibacterium agri]GFG55695.1 membrane protein [Mycolicibacterium agri]